MTTDLYGVNKLLCPVCRKSLTSDEYENAIEEIKLKQREEYQQQIQKERSECEEQIQNERKLLQEKIENINKNHAEQLNVIRTDLSSIYNKQLEDIKRKYEEIDLQRQKIDKEALENKIAEFEKTKSELNRQVMKLQQEQDEIRENALSDARRTVQHELHSKDIEISQKDIRISRYAKTIEDLRLSKTQSETKRGSR